MAGVNTVILIGRLGQDPTLAYTQQGTAVANFSIATSESWTKDGEKQEKTEWHKIVVWKRLAEICGEYLQKGSNVYLSGRLQTRKWEDKEGNTRYTTEIVAREVQFLDGKQQQHQEPQAVYNKPDEPGGENSDTDIPF